MKDATLTIKIVGPSGQPFEEYISFLTKGVMELTQSLRELMSVAEPRKTVEAHDYQATSDNPIRHSPETNTAPAYMGRQGVHDGFR